MGATEQCQYPSCLGFVTENMGKIHENWVELREKIINMEFTITGACIKHLAPNSTQGHKIQIKPYAANVDRDLQKKFQ